MIPASRVPLEFVAVTILSDQVAGLYGVRLGSCATVNIAGGELVTEPA